MVILLVDKMASFLNGPILPMVAAIGGMVYFGKTYYIANKIANKNRKEVQQDIVNNATIILPRKEYYVACAGSNESNVCEKVSAIDIQACNVCDSEGKPLNLSLYDCFVVHGNSMQYAGINDNDFLLVAKGFIPSSLKSFPEILVIRYREQGQNKPLYKVRRAWYKGSIDDNLEEIVENNIFHTPKFEKLRSQIGFKSFDWMITDLINTRLSNYKSKYFEHGICPEEFKEIIISTTFDTKNKVIHFSIHPISLIIGAVKASYTIPTHNDSL